MRHTAVIFDTLQYAKRAKEVGFTEAQAEFQAEEIAHVINDQYEHLATKADLAATKTELEHKIECLHLSIKQDIEYSKTDILLKIGGMLVASVTVLGLLITFVH